MYNASKKECYNIIITTVVDDDDGGDESRWLQGERLPALLGIDFIVH